MCNLLEYPFYTEVIIVQNFFFISWNLDFLLAERQDAVSVPVWGDYSSSCLFRLHAPFFCLKLVEQGIESCIHYSTDDVIIQRNPWVYAKALKFPKYHSQASTFLINYHESSQPAALTTEVHLPNKTLQVFKLFSCYIF